MATRGRWLLAAAFAAIGVGAGAAANDFQTVGDAAILYDAPSLKAKPLFVIGRDTPLEVIVSVEGWVKVRDASGTVAWVERKALRDRRTLIVRVPVADVLASPDANAAVVFKAEQNVLLELADAGYVNNTPGWAKVRHRDGQVGYVRIAQVWGL